MLVTGLGQCSIDYIALVDGFPDEDSKIEAKELVIEGGGPTATALVALSRLGARTRFIGVVGADRPGIEIQKGLKEQKVDISCLITRRRGNSQTAFIVVNKITGSRTIIWQRPTTIKIRPSEVNPDAIKEADLLMLDGLMPEASIKAAQIARKAGVSVMLDAGRIRPAMMDIAALSDHIVASSEFAADISTSPEAALKKLSKLNAKTVTITLGSAGSITAARDIKLRTPAYKIKAIDTTGAGDVFHGGYAWGIINNWPIDKTLRFASALAAIKCLKLGGRAGIATQARAFKLMKRK